MGAQQAKDRSSGGNNIASSTSSLAGGNVLGAGSTLRASRIKPRNQKDTTRIAIGSNIFTEHNGKYLWLRLYLSFILFLQIHYFFKTRIFLIMLQKAY